MLVIFIGWRKSFQLMALLSCMMFIFNMFLLPETLQNIKSKINIRNIIKNYIILFKDSIYTKFLTIKVLLVSVAFVNVATLPLIFVETYNESVENCGLLIGLGALMFAIGGMICNKLVNYFSTNEIIKYSLHLIIISSLTLIFVEWLGFLTTINIQLIKIPYLFAIASIFGNATHKIVSAIPKLAGSASSIMITLEMFVSSIGVRLVSIFYNSTIYPMEVYTIFAVIISLIIFYRYSYQGNELPK